MSTLLEKAKAAKSSGLDVERIDLAIALLRGEVTLAQCQIVLGLGPKATNYAVYRLWMALRDGLRAGVVTINRTPDAERNR